MPSSISYLPVLFSVFCQFASSVTVMKLDLVSFEFLSSCSQFVIDCILNLAAICFQFDIISIFVSILLLRIGMSAILDDVKKRRRRCQPWSPLRGK